RRNRTCPALTYSWSRTSTATTHIGVVGRDVPPRRQIPPGAGDHDEERYREHQYQPQPARPGPAAATGFAAIDVADLIRRRRAHSVLQRSPLDRVDAARAGGFSGETPVCGSQTVAPIR